MKKYSDMHPLAILGTPLDWGAEAFQLKMVRHFEFGDNCISLHEIPERNELTGTPRSIKSRGLHDCLWNTHLPEVLTLD